MNQNTVVLEMLSLVYEDLDIDAIEERFVSMVRELFSFDRVGLFFVKHKKGLLQGKLCSGFEQGSISTIEVPIAEQFLLTRPLITGFPLWNISGDDDPYLQKLGLNYFALIPVVNRKRIPCWQKSKCEARDCPAHGNKWLRCWLVPGTMCKTGGCALPEEKQRLCQECPVFCSHDNNAIEGILLVDSAKSFDEETITMLSIIAHAVGTAINNSKKYSHILREAIHDDLTGLYNRRYFNERLIEEIERARRSGGNLSLLFSDIDHFKRVNDTHGHPVGDVVLQFIGTIFLKHLRTSDLVARYGGEEFAILLIDCTKKQALHVAENLRQAVAEATLPTDEKISVTMSFGIATFGEGRNTLEGLLAMADGALYSAKAQGRNRVCAAG